MRGMESNRRNRGVSEVYGTVLIISLAFLTAFFLIVLGTIVLDELQDETEESLSQDSMAVMDDRLADITGSGVNASTEFQFPDGSGDVDAAPERGELMITVEASNFDPAYLAADEESSSMSVQMGTIAHESNNLITAWQGGGLWEHERGVTKILSPPPLQYDGTVLSLPLVNLTDADHIPDGQAVTAHLDATSSAETSEEVRALFSQHWTVSPNPDLGEVGTDQVDVTVTIESEFVDGWADYAAESMSQPPDHIDPAPEDITAQTEEVTLYFTDVGTELSSEIQTNRTDWSAGGHPNVDVLYSGNSTYALFNNAIAPAGESGFVINETEAAESDSTPEGGADPIAIHLATYHFDEGEFVVYDADGDTWYDVEGDELEEETLETLEYQLGDFDEAITETDGELDGHEGYRVYDFEGPQAICVYAGSPGGGQGAGFFQGADIAEQIDEDCGDTFGIEGDPITLADGPSYQIDEMTVTIDGSPADPGETHAVQDGDVVVANVDITNDGDFGEEQSVIFAAGNRHLDVKPLELSPGATDEVTLGSNVDAAELYYRVDGEADLTVKTSDDIAPSPIDSQFRIDVDWEPENPDVELDVDIDDVGYPHQTPGGEPAVNPEIEGEDTLTVDVTVENADVRDSGTELVNLAYWDIDEQTYRTVAVEDVSVEAGDAESITIEWTGVDDDGNILDDDQVWDEIRLAVFAADAKAEAHNVRIDRTAD